MTEAAPIVEHAYKVAPLGRRVRVRVAGDHVNVADEKSRRTLRSFSLHGVKGGRWSETRMIYAGVPSIASRALILKAPHGTLTLRQGDHRGGTEATPDSQAFHAACAETLATAAALNPELRLGLGPAGYVRWLLAGVGAFAALFALLALLGAVAAILSGTWLEALIFLAAALGAGASALITALSFNPLRRREDITATDLSVDLGSRAGARPS